MKSVMLNQWQRLAIEAGLRELASAGTDYTRAHDESLKALQRIMDNSTQIRVTFEAS